MDDYIPQVSGKDYDGPELLPPKGHKQVGVKVFQLLSEVVQSKIDMGLHEKWIRHYELFRNKHWRRKAQTSIPLVSGNLIFTHVQRTCNTLTDNNPTFNVARISESSQAATSQPGAPPPAPQPGGMVPPAMPPASDQIPQEYFEDIQHAADHWWIDQEQQDVLEASVRNGEMYGICIEKSIFNPDLEYGLGEVQTIIVDPFHFGVYPVTMRDPREIQQAEAVLHYYPMSVREAKRRWPKFAEKIKPDEEYFNELGDERREIGGGTSGKNQSFLTTIASTVKEVFNYFTGTGDMDGDETLIVEAWVHDYTTETVTRSERTIDETTGAEISSEIEETQPVYPGEIRCVVVCNAGKIVLEDKANPSINPELPIEEAQKTYLFDKFPFSAVNSIKDTVNLWGISDIEQLEQLNIEMDKAISQFILYKDKATRLKIINPSTSGVNNDEFTNYPSVINPTNAMDAQAIRYMDPPQMPVDLQAAIQLFKDTFFLIAGTFDVDQAQTQGRSVIAYKAIAALMERAATMMRGKVRSYSRLVRERGRMYLSHVQNWYTEDRWITYQDKSGIEMTKQINGQNLRVPAKLTVVTGSTMPVSKVQQREEAAELFKLKAIDHEDLLDKLEWADRTDVIQRMKQGPIGEVMQKLSGIGVPPPILQMFQQVLQTDPKKFQTMVEQGKVPQFLPFLQQLMAQMQGQPPQGPANDPSVQAEAALKQAQAQKTMKEVEKIEAEKQLVLEQIRSEQIDQQVKMAGVEFDKEKLQMDRAKTVTDIEQTAKSEQADRVKTAHGIQMDRAGLAQGEREGRRKEMIESEKLRVSAERNRPGYNETGMSSNNTESDGKGK